MCMKMKTFGQEDEVRRRRRRDCSRLRVGCVQNSSRSLAPLVISLTLMLALMEIITVSAMPRYRNRGLEDIGDYDDLDQGASAPYQNQEEDGGQNTDGYGDNEPDGPYEETPNDDNSQDQLEKFFDDHLGASEKEGMDRENLPTNLAPIIMRHPNIIPGPERDNSYNVAPAKSSNDPRLTNRQVSADKDAILPYTGLASNPTMSYLHNSQRQQQQQLPSIETSYIKLPNKKLIITRQITTSPIYKGGLDLPSYPSISQFNDENFNSRTNYQQSQSRQKNNLDAKGSEIVATENDNMDRIYVTNVTNKPFKIAQLGGYDPEEDFQDASRDFEDIVDRKTLSSSLSPSSDGSRRNGEEDTPQQTKDISFNDPEDETLFNDASETDEVFFAHDPYQTDLEAELKSEQLPGQAQSDQRDNTNSQDSQAESRSVAKNQPSEEDSEGSWINDGVEDMDIPSQSYQDSVLEKAAKQDALKRAASENPDEEVASQQGQEESEPTQEGEQFQEGEPTQGDPDNQRMPNADYLKDLDDIDDQAM